LPGVEPHVRTAFESKRQLDLYSTLGPIERGHSLRIDRDEAWRATRTPEGPATIHLRIGTGTVAVEAWGPGAEWASQRAASLCGEEDDARDFRPQHRLIADLHRRHPGLRLARTHAVFEALVPAVLGQKVTTIEAKAAYRALVDALGEPAPGPIRMKIPPSPQVLARTPYWAFHRFGVERRRAEVIIRAARSVKRLEETTAMDLPNAYRRLEAFPGVGPWTAAKVALVALGDADAVPVGDYHLPHAIGYALEGTPRSSDERMLELLEPYRGQRARVIRLLTMSGIAAPSFGPHMPLRDIVNN
jgi:3-methyladenine DNA glycosylase/8-oxoguanine DNA glycosylase